MSDSTFLLCASSSKLSPYIDAIRYLSYIVNIIVTLIIIYRIVVDLYVPIDLCIVFGFFWYFLMLSSVKSVKLKKIESDNRKDKKNNNKTNYNFC